MQIAFLLIVAGVTALNLVVLLWQRRLLNERVFWEDLYWMSGGGPPRRRRRQVRPTRLMSTLESAQRRTGVELTWGAQQMLAIPVLEALETSGEVDWEEVDRSVLDILQSMAEEREEPRPPFLGHDSVAVIRAFWRRFCKIPPFCSGGRG